MFESALLSGKSARRRPVPLTIAIVLHAAAVLSVLGASLWRDEELPAPQPPITFVTFAPSPPPAGVTTGSPRGAASGTSRGSASAADPREEALGPREIPSVAAALPALPEARSAALDESDREAVGFGDPSGVEGGAGDTPGRVDPASGSGSGGPPLVIGGEVRAPVLLERTEPEYPESARKARREGIVILQAVIGTDWRVEEIRLVKSAVPMLDDSAIRAVRRWRYRPATLNGRTVRVYLTATADFRLP